jgi:hypothetical protein
MNIIWMALLASVLLAMGSPAMAGDYDGKHNLSCTTTQVFECHSDTACEPVTAEEYGSAKGFVLDFKKKTITSAIEGPEKSDIERVEIIDDQLFVQGIEDGADGVKDGGAWSFAIGSADGIMTSTVARGDGTAFVLLGFCASPD